MQAACTRRIFPSLIAPAPLPWRLPHCVQLAALGHARVAEELANGPLRHPSECVGVEVSVLPTLNATTMSAGAGMAVRLGGRGAVETRWMWPRAAGRRLGREWWAKGGERIATQGERVQLPAKKGESGLPLRFPF